MDVGVLKWQVGISLVSTAWVFSPIGSIKSPDAVTYAYQPGSVVFLLLSDLQAPHLHCLQWRMWSNIHSCHVIACLHFCYHFARPTFIFHSFPGNFPSKTSIVACLVSEASRVIQSQGTYFSITCWPLLQAPVLRLLCCCFIFRFGCRMFITHQKNSTGLHQSHILVKLVKTN